VADIERALHVMLRVYQHPTEKRMFHAPDAEPSLDLAVPILRISGLDNYSLPRPRLQATPLADASKTLPNAGSGPSGTYMGKDFRAAYVPDSSLNGSGQIVGLLQFDGYTASDITYYENQAGLPNITLSNVLIDGATGNPSGSGGEVEVSLDIEMAISMATNLAEVIVYMAPNPSPWEDLLNRMANDNVAKQLSCSWYDPGGAANTNADQIFQKMAAQGQSFFSASGDYDAYTGLIDFPSDDPNITQVGGTTLTTTGPGGSWVSETVWNRGNGIGSGGGISTQYPIPPWQTNINMTASQGSTTMRNTPDVALTSENVYVRANGTNYNVGGTSCAAPLWAGFTALINQQAVASGKPTVGFINPAVSALGATRTYTTAFHDITTGNNTSSSSPTKFYAVSGYDLCTGWGTPSGQSLINALANPDALSIIPLDGFYSSGGAGGPFTITSQSLSLTNTGTNSLSWSLVNTSLWLNVSPSGGTLTPGGASATVTASLNSVASNLVVGTYDATVLFTNLNSNYGQSRQFTLSIINPPTITLQPTNQTVLDGAPATFTVGVSGGLPLYYQWQANSNNLTDGTRISGSATSTLVISNVSPADVANYRVIVTNAAGATVSTNALLTALPGNVDHFSWSTISSPQVFNAPFTASITARDPAGVTATNFNGSVNIAGFTNGSGNTSIEDFESGNWPHAPWISLVPRTPGILGTAYAHDGSYGLSDPGWTYRTDVQLGNAGDILSWWIRPGSSSGGRAYLGFGASSNGCWSIVAAVNTGQFIIEQNTLFDYSNVAFVSQTWQAAKWYKVAVQFSSASAIVCNLYDSDGSTLLNTLSCSNVTGLPGGVAMRSFTGFSLDTIRSGSGTQIPISPTNTGPFANGIWSGNITVLQPATNVVLWADDGSSHTGSSNPFDVIELLLVSPSYGLISQRYGGGLISPSNQVYTLSNRGTNALDWSASCSQAWWVTVDPSGGSLAPGASTNVNVLINTNAYSLSNGVYTATVTFHNLMNGTVQERPISLTVLTLAPTIITQPANQTVFVGTDMTLSVIAQGLPPLGYQWRKDGTNIGSAVASTFTLANVQTNDAGVYSVIVSNAFGMVTSSNATLTVVYGCTPDSFNPVANDGVGCTAVQPDGKIVVGGGFTTLGGQSRSRIGRLNADGTLDTSFNPGANDYVYSLAVQPDGKIVVGGFFTTLGGQSRSYIGRLNADGTLDTSFNPGADSTIYCMAVQADGKIVMGGSFYTLGGQSRLNIGRLNADGTLDTSFNPGANSYVESLAVQADGKILVGGNFTTLGGQSRLYIGRLNANGTLDTGFNPGANNDVYSLAVQADGKILVGGGFTTLCSQSRANLGRLNADGTLDASFNPGASSYVLSLAVQADGEILVGGWFTTLGGQSRSYLGRLNADGTLDTGFNPGANYYVNSLAVQADGKILVGGDFNTLGGQSRPYIGRLTPTGPATQSLAFDGSTITWQRGGSSPEVWRTTFDGSTNGSSWISLGAGTRVAGGWQLTGLTWPTDASLRARGFVAGGHLNGSGWFVETIINPPIAPVITIQPANQTVGVGNTATFNVMATGALPLSYQWNFNGTNIVGAANATLTLTNVQLAQAGSYAVLVTNLYGSALSSNAVLTVVPSTPDSFNPVANNSVLCTAVQADGKIVVGGIFTTLGGQSRSRLGRLNADGTLDTGFNPGANNSVFSLAVQADGKIVVGGYFTTLGGQSRSYLGRLNADGTLDTSFNPGMNGNVYSLAVQADGKIVVGGAFTTLGGQNRSYLGRLNADGTLDTGFNSGASYYVYSLAVQPSGKIVVGGGFTTLGGQSRSYLGRLNADGTLDTGFNPGAGNEVYSLAVQADGKIVVGGAFATLGSQSCARIGRLNADGTLDTSFNPGANNSISSLAVQADGKIVVGGYFTTLGGQSRSHLGQLNADGTLDTDFNPGANNAVNSLAVQADGKILVGGDFNTLGGQSRPYIGRLTPTGPATQSLAFDGSTITWQRGGSSPEVWRTTFDGSTNGSSWIPLGAGTRVAGGWQLTGLTWPTDASLRARGFVTGGDFNGSVWFVETVATPVIVTPPAITMQPTNQMVTAGGTAAFNVTASGTPPLSYQWNFNGTNILGATNTMLTLTDVQASQSGNYAVLVTNAYGSVLSSNATLVVVTLDHFAWNPILSPQYAGQPFGVTITALDAFNVTVSNFNSSVSLAGYSGGVGQTTNRMLDGVVPDQSALGTWTWGYSFTPTNDLVVTHVRSYFGTKVSLWTSTGVLLASQNVGTAGTWTETELGTPVTLAAGSNYVVAAYVPDAVYYWITRSVIGFPNGTINQSLFSRIDTFPTNIATGSWPMVGLRYTVGNAAPISITPTNSGNFVNGVWSGNITALQLATNVVLRADDGSGHTGSSNPFDVLSAFPPVITSQPTNQTVFAGGTATFSVAASGALPLSYQWNFNGTNIVEATNATLTLTNVQLSQAGNYAVLVTNAYGSVLSSNAVLTVNPPSPGIPVITGFSPASGPIGTVVTIFGTNFSPVASNNFVRFEGFRATVLAAGSNSLTVVVLVGAPRGPLTVTVNGMTAYANIPFLVTYPNVATKVVAWGDNYYGQTNVPPGLTNVAAIAAGACADQNLALKTDGTVVVWGDTNHGQADVPPGLTNAIAIASGAYHDLALKADGTVATWGLNNNGQTNVPASLSNTLAVGAGWYHSLALKPDGKVAAWGSSSNGQTNVPAGLSNVVAIAGAPCYNLALKVDGTVVAWGTNYNTPGGIPVQLMDAPPGLSNVVAIAAGYYHCLALKADGTVVAWGDNNYGQTNVPTGLSNVVAIAAGSYNNLVLKADGKMVGWGFYIPDYPPAGLTNVVAISAGYFHSLALVNDSSFGAPIITVQPTNQAVTVGGTATFNVTASGTLPLSYQWSFNTTNIVEATNTTLTLTNVQVSQAGNYTVLVTNLVGSILSSNAVLTVTLDHFTWSPIPAPRFINTPFAVTIQARDLINGLFTNFTGTAILGTTNGVAVTPPVSGNFIQGVWTGTVVISQTASNLVLRADDGLGHFGLANPINVISLPRLGMMCSGNIALYMWPVGYSGFVLETSGSLSPATWVVVPYSPIQIGDQYLLPLDMTGTNGFYRLQFPGP
jgi:uncharacterized delta-60 repeat protein